MNDSGVKEIFLQEAHEIFSHLESDVVILEEKGYDSEILNRIFRYVHTIKGSSGIAGYSVVYEFTHKLEDLMDEVRSGKLNVEPSLVDLILSSIDWIKNELFMEDYPDSTKIKNNLLEQIAEYQGEEVSRESEEEAVTGNKAPSKNSENYYQVKVRFKEDIFKTGIDPLLIMEDLFSLGTVIKNHVTHVQLPEFDELDPEKCYLGWNLVLRSKEPQQKIMDVFIFVKDENEISVEDVTASFVGKDKPLTPLREKKIGEILVEKGVISKSQLEEAIMAQDKKNTKLGDMLIKKKLVSEDQVKEALEDQQALKKKIEVSTVRVDTAKLDSLLNLLGEIVIGQASLTGIVEQLKDETGLLLKNTLYGLDRTTREFQSQIMSIRMVPIGPTFEQFRRFVRDCSHKLCKDVAFKIDGAETELDKTVVEKIADPLKHMIRNSIDHGLETSEEREAAGKELTGNITLKAYHQEGNIFIEVIDDGRGIDISAIKKKAVELGYLKKEEQATNARLLSFLFKPGFSTAEKIGNLSGRGVGMDVVKNNIEDLRGTVEILSEPGKGTTMRIKLPLTLAIIDGMLVGVGKNKFIIPLLSIVESIQPKREEVKTVEDKGEMIYARGEYLSLVRLYDLFGIKAEHKNPWEGLVVVVESDTTRVGLLVDDLLGQQQVVIKSLDSYMSKTRSIAGAAIMGDGNVALIVDIHGLLEDFEKIL